LERLALKESTMTNRENYVCIIELLNFEQMSLEGGRDLLKIRIDNIVNQLKKIKTEIENLEINFFGSEIMFVIDSESSSFERFIELIMDFNKHSLLFGIPYRGVVFKENAISSFENKVNIHISKEYFSAKIDLRNFDLASILINKDLFEEKSQLISKYCVVYEGNCVLKLAKRPLAQIALQGMKNSISNTFNKIGIDDFSSQYSKILVNTLRFVDVQNS
jgi:hypothetical protein